VSRVIFAADHTDAAAHADSAARTHTTHTDRVGEAEARTQSGVAASAGPFGNAVAEAPATAAAADLGDTDIATARLPADILELAFSSATGRDSYLREPPKSVRSELMYLCVSVIVFQIDTQG
jgi:hypothetical protein